MNFIETEIEGLYIVEPNKIGDERGFFARAWCEKEFSHKEVSADEAREIYKDNQFKTELINELEKDTTKLSNKAKFIAEILNDVIDLRRKKNYEVISLLESRDYDKLDNNDQYDYLIKMPMNSVTEENIDKLNNLHNEKTQLLETLQNTTEEHMWITELDSLLEQYTLMYKKKQSKLKIKKKT